MATHQIRIGEDCVKILDAWRYPGESLSDAIRRINRNLCKHKETGINSK
jgi:hypothetical protein